MRTTMDLPEDLLEEAKALSGTRSKTAAEILALKEYIDRKKIDRLRKLKGSVNVERDLTSLRHGRKRSWFWQTPRVPPLSSGSQSMAVLFWRVREEKSDILGPGLVRLMRRMGEYRAGGKGPPAKAMNRTAVTGTTIGIFRRACVSADLQLLVFAENRRS